MFRQFFAGLDSPALPLAAMAFFALAFALVLLRTFVVEKRRDYDPIALLPLEEGEPTNPLDEVKP
jgi:hypothetical protein